ncbi:MAG: methylated-DNA--[protein]-cysteine S-methyltransferase, partial [Alistipes sp.]|nr:methylated-DNA--[protein]-cysteine S-methyltransferase [Alistipes sp.]
AAARCCGEPTPLLRRAVQELQEYFDGVRRSFDLPLAPAGTPFQQQVWSALLEIPYGETRTYGEIAARIGRPKACRAVGMANNRNPIAIFVPCHRVVGASGALVGYAAGLSVKEFLLRLEEMNNL